MMNVSVEGMLLLVGARGDLGLAQEFKRLGDDAFRQCDNDRSGSISYVRSVNVRSVRCVRSVGYVRYFRSVGVLAPLGVLDIYICLET